MPDPSSVDCPEIHHLVHTSIKGARKNQLNCRNFSHIRKENLCASYLSRIELVILA